MTLHIEISYQIAIRLLAEDLETNIVDVKDPQERAVKSHEHLCEQ